MTSEVTPSLVASIFQLRHLVESIQQETQAQSIPIPQTLVNQLDKLDHDLDRLGHQFDQVYQERRNLQALAHVGHVVNSSLELDEVLRIVMDTIIKLTNAERGFLMLKDERGNLSIRVARNWERESIPPHEFAISRTVCNRVISTGQPVLTTDAQEDPRFEAQESIVAHNLRSILCVPLKVKDELTGVIYTDNRMQTGTFSKKELDLLHNFADQAAVALENARLFASVKRTLAEVTELKNLMDNVFASIASGVITTDTEDIITLCNRAAENTLCHPAKELIGHTLEEVFPSLAPYLTSPIYSVRQTGVPIIGLEVSPQLPPRGEVSLRFNLSPLKDAEQNTQGVAIVIDDLTEQKRLEALHRLFERMVSPAVIQQLDPETIQLGGERTMITVLFADVQGFTGYSEDRDPEELVSVLNQYLAAGAEAILKQQGTIDKFLGDAIMAWFNAPIPQPDHTLRAIKAALSMREAIQHLHRRLPPAFQLTFGIGIHYGEAVLGLVGSEHRVDYTAIGDSVNTAKRIQENTDANQILISSQAYELLKGQVAAREMEPIFAKGKKEPILVYEVTGLRNKQKVL